MATERIDPKKQLHSYKAQFDLIQKIPCTKEENKVYTKLVKEGKSLPDGIYRYLYEAEEDIYDFYSVYEPELTEQETMQYLAYKKLELLRTIKNCVVFFTVLTVISLVKRRCTNTESIPAMTTAKTLRSIVWSPLIPLAEAMGP